MDSDNQRFESFISQLNNPDSETRRNAAYQLGVLGDKRAVESLIQVLDDPGAGVIYAAAISLGRLGDERAIVPLINHLDHKSVVFGLQELGKNALLAIIDALQTTQGQTRYNALQGIRQFMHRPGGRSTIKAQAFEPIVQMLQDEDEHNRGYAVAVLGDIGKPEAVPAIQTLIHDSSDYVRWVTAQVLGILGDLTTIPSLEQMQNDSTVMHVNHPWKEDYTQKIGDVAAKSIAKIRERCA